MIKHINKTRMTVVSDLISILTFLVLTLFFRACSAEFNSKLFVEQAESVHLKDANVLEQYKSITDIRTEINTYIEHDSVFDPYLDEICGNVVGNTMMKLLVANIKTRYLPGVRIKIGKDDEFFPDTDEVTINPENYTATGKAKDPLCGINKLGRLVEKYDTIGEALFHELCHAFHWKSGILKYPGSPTLNYVYRKREYIELWTSLKQQMDEELYNITGRFHNGLLLDFDPISCNMYDICKYAVTPDSIIQRVFHWYWKPLQRKLIVDPLYKIDQFLIDLNVYILTKN